MVPIFLQNIEKRRRKYV